MEPPDEELLVFKGPRASELDGRLILFNWPAIGWMVGTLQSNTDGRVKMKEGNEFVPCNFCVEYGQDEETSDIGKHNLQLDHYGDNGLSQDGAWLLLARMDC